MDTKLRALELAVQAFGSSSPEAIVAAAKAFEAFLTGRTE